MIKVDLDELKEEYRYITTYERRRKPLFLDGCHCIGADDFDYRYYECNGVLFVPDIISLKDMITADKKCVAYTKYAQESRELEYRHRQAGTDWFSELREMLYEYTEELKESTEQEWFPELKETTIYPAMAQEIKVLINKYSETTTEYEVNYGYIEKGQGKNYFTSYDHDISKLKRKDHSEVIQIKPVGGSDDEATYYEVGLSNRRLKDKGLLNTLSLILFAWNAAMHTKPIKGVPAL